MITVTLIRIRTSCRDAPVFSSASSKFVVANAGQGGRCGSDYRQQKYCLRNICGEDTDAIHYSWTYFEAGDSDEVQDHEAIIRWALRMRNSPSLQLLNVGELFSRDACGNALGPKSMFNAYAKYGANSFCLQTGLTMSGKWGGKVWKEIGNGLHQTTRYAPQGNDKASKARRNSLGVVFRNWHPGPLGFQVVADTYAYYYAHAMLKAIDLLEAAAKGTSLVRLKRKFKKTPKAFGGALPKPIACTQDTCNSYKSKTPFCLYFEKPQYGSSKIRLLSNTHKKNPKNTKKGTFTGFKQNGTCPNHLIPTAEKDLPKCATYRLLWRHVDRKRQGK